MKKLGKYEVLGELGHGAMGVVYRARDPIINRLVALKTITTGVADDPAMLQRFYREAQSAGGLQHPNIVTIYDMGEAGELPYIAMELVEGENLEQIIARRSALPLTLKLVYAMQACRAFDYAHKRGIVHRDIKPGNVMVTKDGTVKVVDFGIARVLETSKTQTGMLIGTFAYMSPEQYHGEHADERSDIWSFGVLLYELLGYQRPFTGPTPASLMHCICTEDPSPLSKLLPECPNELDVIIFKILRKSPSERYQSMEDVLLDLEPVCKRLQLQFVADLVDQSGLLIAQGQFGLARDLVRQALQVESGNQQARALLERANTELKRIQNRPKAQQYVERGQVLLGEGKIQEARVAAENALQLDSNFAPAQDLERAIARELDRARLLAEWLEAAKQNLAEGMLDEAEVFLAKVLLTEPSHAQALAFQEQVVREKTEREKRRRLLERLRHARDLWTRENYGECVKLLGDLGREFPGEEEVSRLLETVREDQTEHEKQQALLESRNLLAAGRHEECFALLSGLQKQFPADEEIPGLLEDVRKDQMNQRRLQGLADARSVLAAGQYDDCISLLTSLSKEFPDEQEIPRLLETAHQYQAEQRRQRGMTEARKFLAARRYEECTALLTTLENQFPGDAEILSLQNAVREEQAEQWKQQRLEEIRKLLGARRHEECMALLTNLEEQFPADGEILKLQSVVREDQAKQRKLQGLEEVRQLLASKDFPKSLALLASLQKEFPEEDEIRRLLTTARKEQAEQRKREGLAQARSHLAARRYDESIAHLNNLQADFPGENEIAKLLATAREDLAEQRKQQKLAEARSLLAAQSFGEALTLLDSLAADHPKDSAVLKLRVLVQQEQEKYRRAEKIQYELDALKKLVGEKKYPEVISRAKELLIEFPSETNFTRLAEFAMSQQANIEREHLLRKTIEESKAFLDSGRFEEAMRIAQNGLKTFPANLELLDLYKQSEIQQRKLQIRQQVEQRIREIRGQINREKFSEAIDLAKQTLATLGPDTDLTQLLNSAQVEIEAREKKRLQEQSLQTIRTLLESGDLDGASRKIDEVLESKTLESFDPRVQRLSEQIKEAKSAPVREPSPSPSQAPPNFSKEYAFLQAAPLPDDSPAPEQDLSVDTLKAQVSGSQPVHLPRDAAPGIPSEAALSAPDAVLQPAPQTSAADVKLPDTSPNIFTSPIEVKESKPPVVPPAVGKALPTAPSAPVPVWRKPVFAAVLTLGLIAAIWAGLRFVMVNPSRLTPPAAKTKQEPAKPHVNPLEMQQREALIAADKLIASDNLNGALQELQQAAGLNGPLTPEIDKKRSEITESMNDARLRLLRQHEAQLWKQATNYVDKQRYTEAQNDLRQILKLPAGGVRRDDAQNYLDKVIPQRVLQNGFLTQARQALKMGDFQSARQAASQLQQRGGDSTEVVTEIDQQEQGRLAQLESQFNQLRDRDDDAAAQQLKALQSRFQALANDPGPQASEALSYVNNVSVAIGEVRTRAQKKSVDAAFQQMVQRYHQAASAKDKNALAAARTDFQAIVQGGGPRADDAQKLLAELDDKLAALNQPAVAPAPPPAKIENSPPPKVDNDGDVRAVIRRYADAFNHRDADALSQVWRGIGSRYARYKSIFSMASAIRMQVDIDSVEISPDSSTAVVKAHVSQDYSPKGSKTQTSRDAAIFQMAKVNGAWVITDVR